MNTTDKKVELFFQDCMSSVDIKHNSNSGYYTLTVTEWSVDNNESTEHITKHKRNSVTEIYVGTNEIDSLISALQYLRSKQEVV